MTVGLFIPCYIDMLYPHIGMAVVDVLEKLNIPFEVPMQQTCCGQPLYNTGCNDKAKNIAEKFIDDFSGFDCIITPSASCAAMIKHHYNDLGLDHNNWKKVAANTMELTEFLYEMISEITFKNAINKQVSLHQSCHGLRELHLGSYSESNCKSAEKTLSLLEKIPKLKILPADRQDECCGFGGLFSVQEKEVSTAMGRRKVTSHCQTNSEIILSADMSCLMHLEGVAKDMKANKKFMHVAELFSEALA